MPCSSNKPGSFLIFIGEFYISEKYKGILKIKTNTCKFELAIICYEGEKTRTRPLLAKENLLGSRGLLERILFI